MRALSCFLLACLTACSTLNWHDSLESLPAMHSVVTGRVRVFFRGADATPSCKIGFRGNAPSYRLDNTGRVAFRLPSGSNEISSIACTRANNTEHWKFLRPGELVIEVAEAPRATYFGDVTLRWESQSSYDGADRTLSSLGNWANGNGDFLEAVSGGDPLFVEVTMGSSTDLASRLGYQTELVAKSLRVAPHLLVAPRGSPLP